MCFGTATVAGYRQGRCMFYLGECAGYKRNSMHLSLMNLSVYVLTSIAASLRGRWTANQRRRISKRWDASKKNQRYLTGFTLVCDDYFAYARWCGGCGNETGSREVWWMRWAENPFTLFMRSSGHGSISVRCFKKWILQSTWDSGRNSACGRRLCL